MVKWYTQGKNCIPRKSECIFKCVFFSRDKIGVLNGQWGQLYSSISILCSRHKCVCKVFQFQFRLDVVFVDAVTIIIDSPSFTELETFVAIAGTGAPVAVTVAPTDVDVVSISHFGHRISLLFNEWHCSCNNIAACVSKRIPQLLTLHLVVMTLVRLLIPSERRQK